MNCATSIPCEKCGRIIKKLSDVLFRFGVREKVIQV